jgi:hypothetical protein
MSENVNVQYAGFQAKALVREYSFLVRQASNETRAIYTNDWQRGV